MDMIGLNDVLTNIGDFAARQWSPDLNRVTMQPVANGARGDLFNGKEAGSYLWSGASNAYSDSDIAGYRRPRAVQRNSPLQVRRMYERNLMEAARLIKAAFDGNGYARLMFRDAMYGDRRIMEALSISDFPNLFGDVIDRAVL